MQATTVRDRDAGIAGLSLTDLPYPHAVEPDRARLAGLAARLRDGRLKPVVGAVRPLAEAPAAFAPDKHTHGKTILRVTED